MREIFLQFVYGRTQTAFSLDGLPIGAGLEDLGKGLRSQVYMEMAEGYVTKVALDENEEIIGYRFVNLGKLMKQWSKQLVNMVVSMKRFVLSIHVTNNQPSC